MINPILSFLMEEKYLELYNTAHLLDLHLSSEESINPITRKPVKNKRQEFHRILSGMIHDMFAINLSGFDEDFEFVVSFLEVKHC